ncbi:MAG: T9SS type A sorting domain-containing protein, partial [Bacteroidetes bacterium]|nr:T9SS type A sorting domain-containing protein [Bacteroidota bacterium]
GLLTSVSTFGEDMNGELYVAKLNTGRIYKLSGDCPDSTIQVTIELVGDSIVSNVGNGNLTWLKDGNDLPDQNSGSIALQGEGNYLLNVVVNNNGCHYYGTSNLLNYLEDFECPDTSLTITIEQNGDSIYQNGGPEGTYVWLRDGSVINGGSNAYLIHDNTVGELSLVVTYELFFNDNMDTCAYRDTSNIIAPIIIPGIFNQSIGQIQLYPNPSSRKINANLPREIVNNIQSIRLLNIQGQQERFVYSLEATNLNLDISKLSKGVYFLEISTNSERYLGKVMKE